LQEYPALLEEPLYNPVVCHPEEIQEATLEEIQAETLEGTQEEGAQLQEGKLPTA
jgi:hypothetical protein